MHKSLDTFFEAAEICEENSNKKNFSYWQYRVISEYRYHADIGKYYTYGIQVTGPGCFKTLQDISTYEEKVVWMVKLFNRHQLSPIHFHDTVEDMLP